MSRRNLLSFAGVVIVVLCVWYVWYRRMKDKHTIIDTFAQRTEDAITQMETLIDRMFESEFNEAVFQRKLRLVLDHTITFSVNSQMRLLKFMNTKLKSVSKESTKTGVEKIYNKLIDEYMEQRSVDISCIINISSCETTTQMQGTCGTLVNKMKSAMNKESELKKYKEFLEDLKELMGDL